MAIIDDPQVTKWSNEDLRPGCEDAQILVQRYEASLADFDAEIAPLIGTNRDDTIDDGRENDGSSRLNVGDILDAVESWRVYVKCFNGDAVSATPAVPGRRETQRKPSVRSRAR